MKITRNLLLPVLTLLLLGSILPVLAAPMAANVTASVDDNSKAGIPGSVVNYTLTLQNNEAVDSPVSISASSAGGWTDPVVVPESLTIPASGSSTVTVSIPIPSSASAGQNDITTVFVKDGSSTVIATLQLTTTASAPAAAGRPLVVITSYSTGDVPIYTGRDYDLLVGVKNAGQSRASNIVITFSGTEFYPRETGGVRTIGKLEPGAKNSVSQKFMLGDSLAWSGVTSLTASITYTDSAGNSYTEPFTISIKIAYPTISGTSATATPVIPLRPQLVVTTFSTDVDPLQPGSIFDLKLDIKNLGLADAKSVTVVLGGGVTQGSDGGTPQPGGVSGSGSDLTNFAPIGSSNVIFIGDVPKDSIVSMSQKLVVNVNTVPGAYSFKLSFVYNDPKGNRLVDDQVITLLVYSLPQVELSFYRDPGFFQSGMETILPIQVTNLGKKSYVLGNMKVTAEGADVLNNVSLVGALDPGGYYTLDSSLIPFQEGPMEIKVSINYTDDFNQPRFIEQVIPINVEPAMVIEPTMEGGPVDGGPDDGGVEPMPETFWAKVARFFKGLFGLDSGVEKPEEIIVPTEEFIPAIPKG